MSGGEHVVGLRQHHDNMGRRRYLRRELARGMPMQHLGIDRHAQISCGRPAATKRGRKILAEPVVIHLAPDIVSSIKPPSHVNAKVILIDVNADQLDGCRRSPLRSSYRKGNREL